MIRITMAVPEVHIAAANQLARCIGYSEADGETFSLAPIRLNAAGERFAVASSVVEPAFLSDAGSALVAPAWGADMAAAAAAQALIVVHHLDTEADHSAAPDQITAVVSEDPEAATVAMGLLLL